MYIILLNFFFIYLVRVPNLYSHNIAGKYFVLSRKQIDYKISVGSAGFYQVSMVLKNPLGVTGTSSPTELIYPDLYL